MTLYHRTHVGPTGDASPMTAYMGGTDRDIPLVEITADKSELSISLGNHDDPVSWLRDSAQQMLNLADLLAAVKAAETAVAAVLHGGEVAS